MVRRQSYSFSEIPLSQSAIWPDAKILKTKQFRDACVEAHNAIFWVARGANSFLEAMPQNQHLSLLWVGDSQDFRTRYFEKHFQIGLNIRELEIYFCENGVKVPHSFCFDDRTPAFAEAWYLVELLHRDLDQSKFATSLPFDSPFMLMGDTQDHNASLYNHELEALHVCLLKSVRLFGMSIFSSPHRNFPVSDSLLFSIFLMSPSATIRPPWTPAPGPMSII